MVFHLQVVTSTGKGFEEPIMSNDTEEGRATNRRIRSCANKKNKN